MMRLSRSCRTSRFVGTVPGFPALVLQHNRKADIEDPIDLISGTLGGPGVADTLLVLRKNKSRADPDCAAAMLRKLTTPSGSTRRPAMVAVGPADTVHLSETRKKILDALLLSKWAG